LISISTRDVLATYQASTKLVGRDVVGVKDPSRQDLKQGLTGRRPSNGCAVCSDGSEFSASDSLQPSSIARAKDSRGVSQTNSGQVYIMLGVVVSAYRLGALRLRI